MPYGIRVSFRISLISWLPSTLLCSRVIWLFKELCSIKGTGRSGASDIFFEGMEKYKYAA